MWWEKGSFLAYPQNLLEITPSLRHVRVSTPWTSWALKSFQLLRAVQRFCRSQKRLRVITSRLSLLSESSTSFTHVISRRSNTVKASYALSCGAWNYYSFPPPQREVISHFPPREKGSQSSCWRPSFLSPGWWQRAAQAGGNVQPPAHFKAKTTTLGVGGRRINISISGKRKLELFIQIWVRSAHKCKPPKPNEQTPHNLPFQRLLQRTTLGIWFTCLSYLTQRTTLVIPGSQKATGNRKEIQ